MGRGVRVPQREFVFEAVVNAAMEALVQQENEAWQVLDDELVAGPYREKLLDLADEDHKVSRGDFPQGLAGASEAARRCSIAALSEERNGSGTNRISPSDPPLTVICLATSMR